MFNQAVNTGKVELPDIGYELSSMQKRMYICNKLPIYRLPLFYELEASMTYSSIYSSVYHTLINQITLQVKYFYDAEHRKFFQKVIPLQQEEFTIPQIEINEDIILYITKQQENIDLTKDYPWRIQFLQHKDKRYLYIEFHHICIDGLGIGRFEEVLFQHLLNQVCSQSQSSLDLSTYHTISELQSKSVIQPFPSLELLKLPTQELARSSQVGRVTDRISQDRLTKIDRIAKKLNVTKNTVYQGLIEQVLSKCCVGQVYGAIGNWRMNLGNFNEVGCFVKLSPKVIMSELNLEDRVKQIFIENWNGFGKIEEVTSTTPEFNVVYSYEEDMFHYFHYISVDQLVKFDIYFRVYVQQEETNVEVEYNKGKYTEQQITDLYEPLYKVLDSYEEEEVLL
ncbi:condensation domain-containing protein [Paenibacillus macquariensis]|uniref:Condensation domain-containing protein n=1 Tax=Paenibacillus macquariensis TaxID=948756 RepID=A0ABY1K2Y6_9BACL|nr:condensation domain-containing protein [Paenibacillus macquariensis]MEC0090283.1 condensation domain-containing protein [Paenibacillus macquariensis]OAB39643.1 hypothetical protein PMSM_00505 [Paenibacillus macquariensis subsp. macquariensis]SIR18771.1 Condensation domain-containing protein [Paenibacillus macquariensis]